VKVFNSDYIFYKDRFYSVTTYFKENSGYNIFMDALILKYGEPTNKGPLVLKMNPKAIIGEECLWDL